MFQDRSKEEQAVFLGAAVFVLGSILSIFLQSPFKQYLFGSLLVLSSVGIIYYFFRSDDQFSEAGFALSERPLWDGSPTVRIKTKKTVFPKKKFLLSGKCSFCNEQVQMPFQCSYCSLAFCSKHRIPENHECARLPRRGSH